MADTATALLALWNDVDRAFDAPYNDWHANEHVPERLTVPGILWGRRYGGPEAEGMPRYLTLYGLQNVDVLDSPAYLRLLHEPTPMSRTMRPRLRNVSRWVCTLHKLAQLDKGTHLAVQVLAGDAEPAHPDVDARYGRLLAERLPQARPLPWLQATQDHGIDGRWLVCVPVETGARPEGATGGVVLYARLPVEVRRP
jgi:hypothetical protein